MLELRFERLRFDGPTPVDRSRLLLAIVAEFSILIDGEVWFSQPEFPVVELAAQLGPWLGQGATGDFFYRSLEADEPYLISFRKLDQSWRLASPWQRHPETSPVDPRQPSEDFVRRLTAETRQTLGVDITPALASKANKTR